MAGAEKYLLNLLPGLSNHNVECELLCVGPKKYKEPLLQYLDLFKNSGIQVTYLPVNSKLNFVSAARKINHFVKERNIHVIHSHLFNADILAVLTKRLFNRNLFLISTKHGYQEDFMIKYGQDRNLKPSDFYFLINRYILKHIDENIASSKAIADLYYNTGLLNKTIDYIHHGVKIEKKETIHAPINGNPKIMIIGRLEKIKGHRLLIEALPSVIKKFPSLKLLVLGTGSLESDLKNYTRQLGISDHVEFLGFKNPSEFSSQVEVIVLPSFFESFGLVFIEAFASKIPVVSFDAPAANEIIVNNQTGLLAETYKSNSLANNIIFLLENPHERKRIAENAYEKYINYFTVERMVAETSNWYKKNEAKFNGSA